MDICGVGGVAWDVFDGEELVGRPNPTHHPHNHPTNPTPTRPQNPQVVAKVWGYRKVWLQSNRVFETGVFSLPPLEYETKGFFIDLPLEVQQEVRFSVVVCFEGMGVTCVKSGYRNCDDDECAHVRRPIPHNICT